MKLLAPELISFFLNPNETQSKQAAKESIELWPLCRALGLAYHQLGAALSCLAVPLGVQAKLPLGHHQGQALQELDSILVISFVFSLQEEGHVCIPLKDFYSLWHARVIQRLKQSIDSHSLEAVNDAARFKELCRLQEAHCPNQTFLPGLMPDCFDVPAIKAISLKLSYQDLLQHWSGLAGATLEHKALLFVSDSSGQLWCHSHASFVFETRVVKRIRQLIKLNHADHTEVEAAEDVLKHVSHLDSHQLKACKDFALQRFALLTGGPGTGKTSTAFFMLWNWWQHFVAEHGRPPRIKLSAPTGRAAARLAESLKHNRQHISGIEHASFFDWLEQEKPATVHSLIYGEHARSQLLSQLDLLVIDEASMLALSLMAKVLDGLSASAGLLLIGDPDQLPSIDSGALVADFAGQAANSQYNSGKEPDFVHRLETCHRSNKSISEAAALIRTGLVPQLTSWDGSDIQAEGVFLAKPDAKLVCKTFRAALNKKAPASDSIAEQLETYQKVTVLTPQKEGPLGSKSLNHEIQRELKLGIADSSHEQIAVPGLSVLITKNNARWKLFNGDKGILASSQTAELRFFSSTGPEEGIPVSLLGEYEAGFAMTVHKSQGSEYPLILLAIPESAASWASRELLYTALTRASRQVILFSTQEILETIVARRTQRYSLINQALLTE